MSMASLTSMRALRATLGETLDNPSWRLKTCFAATTARRARSSNFFSVVVSGMVSSSVPGSSRAQFSLPLTSCPPPCPVEPHYGAAPDTSHRFPFVARSLTPVPPNARHQRPSQTAGHLRGPNPSQGVDPWPRLPLLYRQKSSAIRQSPPPLPKSTS